jgi:predicted dehydrogenase
MEDPALPCVLVLSGAPDRAQVVAAAVNAGKVAMCPFPPATDANSLAALADAQASGGGIPLSVGEIAGTAPGATALEAVREGQLGTLHSIWAAARFARHNGAPQSVLDQYGWQVLDFVLSAVPGGAERVHASLACLFEEGNQPDTAVVLLRFAHDVVVTIELSRCLPFSVLAPEVEIEVIGAKEVVRIEPHASERGWASRNRSASWTRTRSPPSASFSLGRWPGLTWTWRRAGCFIQAAGPRSMRCWTSNRQGRSTRRPRSPRSRRPGHYSPH